MKKTGVAETAAALALELRARAPFARDGVTGAALSDLLLAAARQLEAAPPPDAREVRDDGMTARDS